MFILNIYDYIKEYYNNDPKWFLEHCNSYNSKQREIINNYEYLEGNHKVLQRQGEQVGTKYYSPDNTVIQLGKKILEFHTSFLLSKPITFAGDENIVEQLKDIYKRGRYQGHDFDILFNALVAGRVAEYLYFDDKKNIKAKLLNPVTGRPIYNDFSELIGYIDHWEHDAVSHWVIYYPDKVEHYSNNGGDIRLINTYTNASGLPVMYEMKNSKSLLEDFMNMIDKLEKLESKFFESVYRFHTPIPVYRGRVFNNENKQINPHLVGEGIHVDFDSDLELKQPKVDYKAFESAKETLINQILAIANVPDVTMGKVEISNISTESMKTLYSRASDFARVNQQMMNKGYFERFDKIRNMLALKGITFTDDVWSTLDIVFDMAIPESEQGIIENLVKSYEAEIMSLDSVLEHHPMINDVVQEKERINESKQVEINEND